MLHIVDAHPECMVANEKAPRHPVRRSKEHRCLRPEEPVQQVSSTKLERFTERDKIDPAQKMRHLRQIADPTDQRACSHHQFKKRGKSGDALPHEIQMTGDILQPEDEIALAAQLLWSPGEPRKGVLLSLLYALLPLTAPLNRSYLLTIIIFEQRPVAGWLNECRKCHAYLPGWQGLGP